MWHLLRRATLDILAHSPLPRRVIYEPVCKLIRSASLIPQQKGTIATVCSGGIWARDRLRPEFALRQVLDPPRYDVGSRMPRFAPDLQTTAVKQIEGGKAKKQFEAIKQYLWSLKADVSED